MTKSTDVRETSHTTNAWSVVAGSGALPVPCPFPNMKVASPRPASPRWASHPLMPSPRKCTRPSSRPSSRGCTRATTAVGHPTIRQIGSH